MKKILTILLSVLILSIGMVIPSYAEGSVSVDIPITSTTPSTIEITGESNLPDPATFNIQDKYTCTLTFSEIGTYNYQIKQVSAESEDVILDTTVYNVEVLVVKEDGLKAYVSIYPEGETAKVESVDFNNTVKEPEPEPEPEPNTTKVLIKKVSDQNKPLKDAELVLLNSEDSSEVEKWTTTEEAYTLELLDGSYTIHEEVAPKGYEAVEDFDFTIEEGQINLTESDNVTLSENVITITDPSEVVPPVKKVKTGDTTRVLIYVISLGLAVILLAFVLIRRKKNAKNL